MSTAVASMSPEAEVRAVLDDWLVAVNKQDLDGIIRHYAPDVVAFDAIAQLQFKGVEAYRAHWAACFEMCPTSGTMVCELHDVAIDAGADRAFGHCLTRCGMIEEGGTEKLSWMRGSLAWRKLSGRWQVVHEHWSAPFDPASGKALFDAQP
jgi:uncharacterized protein (TIGR02246 family)